MNRSVAAGLTCTAVLAVVGGAVYVVTVALVDTWDRIVASLRRAVRALADHFGAGGTSLEDLADDALALLGRFGGTTELRVGRVRSHRWTVEHERLERAP